MDILVVKCIGFDTNSRAVIDLRGIDFFCDLLFGVVRNLSKHGDQEE